MNPSTLPANATVGPPLVGPPLVGPPLVGLLPAPFAVATFEVSRAAPRVRLERDCDAPRGGDEFTTFGTGLARPEASFEAGDGGLRASGREAPVVTKAGKRAYEVTYRAGKIHAEGSDMHAYFVPRGFFPAEQARFSFRVRFADNFPWTAAQERVGGKLLGFRIGDGDAQGGDYSPTASSFRLTWAVHGGVGPYLYPEVRDAYSKAASGNIDWDRLDQSADVRRVSQIASGVHMFYPRDRAAANWDLRLHKRRWNEVEMFCRLNTPGRHDGVLEVTVNGVTKRIDSVRYRYDDAKIESVKLSTFFGGGTDAYAPPEDTKVWFADFGFSRA